MRRPFLTAARSRTVFVVIAASRGRILVSLLLELFWSSLTSAVICNIAGSTTVVRVLVAIVRSIRPLGRIILLRCTARIVVMTL